METTTAGKHNEAIRQLDEDWRTGWLTRNAELLLSLFAAEPVGLPQDQPAVVGIAAIRAIYESVLKDYQFTSDSRVVEIEVSGNLAYLGSTYCLTATPKAGGQPIKSTGKSLFIRKRAPDGRWKIARLMDNSDSAPS